MTFIIEWRLEMLDLGEIRNKIDVIDRQLVNLFEERMQLCEDVARYKIETGKKVLDPEREKAKLAVINDMINNKEFSHGINDLFEDIALNLLPLEPKSTEAPLKLNENAGDGMCC